MLKKLLLLFVLALPAIAAEEGFIPLTNGKDLTGWKVVGGNGEYKAEEGNQIIGSGRNVKANTFLITEKTYKNFDLRFEMKFGSPAGNSGVMFRGLRKPGENGRVYGYQCEHDDSSRSWTAGLFDEARRGWLAPYRKGNGKDDTPEAKALQKAFTEAGTKLFKKDDWNEIRILAEGSRLQIWLNGEQRVDYKDEAPEFTPEGFIGLQVHSGKAANISWRNLRIKEL